MPAEDIQKFREYAANNASAFQEEYEAALASVPAGEDGRSRTFQALIAVGEKHGYSFTQEELAAAEANTELSDSELAHIAGGAGS
jgi:hypothetical protein